MDECDIGLRATEAMQRAGIARARRRLYGGEGLSECEDCGEEIPEKRRALVPGCTRCVACQTRFEKGLG